MSKRGDKVLARPLEEQRLAVDRYVKAQPDFYARHPVSRRAAYNLLALDRHQWDFYRWCYRSTSDEEWKVLFSELARTESRQAVALGPSGGSALLPLERALAHGQAAVDTVVQLAQEEPDGNLREGFEYIVLELLEHANLFALRLKAHGRDPEAVTQGLLPLRSGRPIEEQHWTSFDAIKRPYDWQTVDPLSRARLLMITACTRALYEDTRSIIGQIDDQESRLLAARVHAVQGEHVAFCESFFDPRESVLQRALAGELAEVTFYRRYYEQETDERQSVAYRDHLSDEVAHLALWEDQLRSREDRDPWALTHSRQEARGNLRPANEYLPTLLVTQLQRRSKGKGYVEIGKTIEAFS